MNPFRSRVQTSISSWQYANVQWPGYKHSFPTATSEKTVRSSIKVKVGVL